MRCHEQNYKYLKTLSWGLAEHSDITLIQVSLHVVIGLCPASHFLI